MIDWTSKAPALVLDAVKSLQEEAEKNRTHAYDTRQNCYEGGEKTKPYLIRHPGESATAWTERQQRFTDCGLTRRIAGAFIGALGGHEITRTIVGASDELAAYLAALLQRTRIDSKQRMIYQDQCVSGDGFSLVSYSDRLGELHLHSVDPGNMFVIPDEDDPMRSSLDVERRIDPARAGKFKYWIWNAEVKNLIDDTGKPLDQGGGKFGWQENPYSVSPYTHWRGLPLSESYWGMSPIGAVVEIHKYCNNLRTQLDRVVLYQAHSLLVISGTMDPKINTGESNALVLDAEGTAAFLAPNANIDAVRGAYELARTEAFQIAGIPQSIYAGGQVASGYALVVESVPFSISVGDLAVEARGSEVEMLRKFCAIGSKHGLALPDDPEVAVDMNISVIPHDKDRERDQDWLEVLGGGWKMADYIRKWRPEIDDPDAYAAELEATKAVPAFGAPAPAGSGGFQL